jgi:hypothetical protein
MADDIQNEDLVKADLRRQEAMEAERAPWESTYRDIERYVDPTAGGGFDKQANGGRRGLDLFDSTALRGLGRFDAALGYVTTPKNDRWHGLTVVDKDLARDREAERWLQVATDRMFACRYAMHVGASLQYSRDRRALGGYGTGALLVDEWKGRGLYYRALHMSEVFVDEDFRGRIDTVHRKFELTARQARDEFGADNLPPKILTALGSEKGCEEKFQFLHVCRPNERYETERLDWRGKPIVSRYIAVAEKWIVRQGGYFTMPIAVSRNVTSPGEKYGRSPAMEVLGNIKALNQMAKTIVRGAHKKTDPALAFYDDDAISKLTTKPGGLNPGLVDERGNLLVAQIPSGQPEFGLEFLESERGVVKETFLEDFFKMVLDDKVQRSAAAVLEIAQKQGVLIGPFADAYESEKLGVMGERELDILIRAGQIPPMPPVMTEAGARPLIVMTNPLARMARAGEAAAFTRWVEVAVQAAGAGRPDALDRINFDDGMVNTAEVLGVRPSSILSDEELTELRRARAAKEEAAQAGEVAPKVAGAALDLARAEEISGGGQMGMAA